MPPTFKKKKKKTIIEKALYVCLSSEPSWKLVMTCLVSCFQSKNTFTLFYCFLVDDSLSLYLSLLRLWLFQFFWLIHYLVFQSFLEYACLLVSVFRVQMSYCLFVLLPTSIFLPFYSSVHRYFSTSVFLHFCLMYISPPIYLSFHPSVHLSICLSPLLPYVHLFFCPSVYLSFHPSVSPETED